MNNEKRVWIKIVFFDTNTFCSSISIGLCMKYNGVYITLSTWFPPFVQGFTINSKRVFVKFVFDPTKKKVHLDSTIDVIQHELYHTKQIKEMFVLIRWLWIPRILLQYMWYGYKNSPLEKKASDLRNRNYQDYETIKPLLIDKLNKIHLEYY